MARTIALLIRGLWVRVPRGLPIIPSQWHLLVFLVNGTYWLYWQLSGRGHGANLSATTSPGWVSHISAPM